MDANKLRWRRGLALLVLPACWVLSACQGIEEPTMTGYEAAGDGARVEAQAAAAEPSARGCRQMVDNLVDRVVKLLDRAGVTEVPLSDGPDPCTGQLGPRTMRLLIGDHQRSRVIAFGLPDSGRSLLVVEQRLSLPAKLQAYAEPSDTLVAAAANSTLALACPDGSVSLSRAFVSDVPVDVGQAEGSNPHVTIDLYGDGYIEIGQVECQTP